MKKYLLIILIILSNYSLLLPQASLDSLCEKWNALDKLILNQKIDKDAAIRMLERYENDIIKYFKKNNISGHKKADWVFPLSNYSSIVHREDGKDFRDYKYDYFQGSDASSHPAHDIFIADTNKDCLDDATGKPVDVVSMSGGVVAATDTTWEIGSYLRGGKYVKIFDVTNMKIFYYSHLNTVYAKPGDLVKPGDKIAEVGRTGRSAILKGGLTHLHIALLSYEDGYPKPEEIFGELKRVEKKN
jgi:hypothetical protein